MGSRVPGVMPAKIELDHKTISAIQSLRYAGLSIRQVADAVHLSYGTVYRVLNPEASESHRQRERARHKTSQRPAADLQQRIEELSARLDRVEALLDHSVALSRPDQGPLF